MESGEKNMNMIDWAENEIRIALARENENDDFYEYIKACYESALKAYKSLCDDGHSGMSISVTRNILNRLIRHQPLTPIEDVEDVWTEHFGMQEDDRIKVYQCKRMGCFWQNVYPDGTIRYQDNDRACGVNMNNPVCTYHSGLATRIVDEMYPIAMPYCPPNQPYMVYTEEFLFDPRNGDFDTVHIHYIRTPEGDKVDVNRMFTTSEDGRGWKEITPEELDRLKAAK